MRNTPLVLLSLILITRYDSIEKRVKNLYILVEHLFFISLFSQPVFFLSFFLSFFHSFFLSVFHSFIHSFFLFFVCLFAYLFIVSLLFSLFSLAITYHCTSCRCLETGCGLPIE